MGDGFHAEKYAVNPKTGCWLWHAARSYGGYGRMLYKGQLWQSHRAFYDHYRGRIPSGRVLHHTCEQRNCVNPSHLLPVTGQVNVQIGGKTKLNRRDVRKIRAMARRGMPYVEIARHFGITDRCASFVARGIQWGNVA